MPLGVGPVAGTGRLKEHKHDPMQVNEDDAPRISSTVLSAVRSVIDRLVALSTEDRELRLRLRAVALEYLKATEERPAVVEAPPTPAAEKEAAGPIAPFDVEQKETAEAAVVRAAVAPVVVKPAEPLVGKSPQVVEKPVGGFLDVTDADLPLIEARCLLKMEGARWAATRSQRLQAGADYFTEIGPLDRELIEKARQLPDCFLWMCHSSGPSPSDLSQWADVAGCFATVASGIGVIRSLLEAEADQDNRFEQAIFLLAEAQSALKVALDRIGGIPDKDQNRVYHWLKATAFSRQFYIPRYMRVDDRADPTAWADLEERIGKLDATIQQGRQYERRKQSTFNRIRYHLKAIVSNGAADRSYDWRKVIDAVEELTRNGTPPSNRELRDLLLPAVDGMPDLGDLPPGFTVVLREIDRFLATRTPTAAAEVASEPNEDLKEAAKLLNGKSIVLIGGDRRPFAQQALEEAFGLKELDWISTAEHESILPFEAHIARPDVAAVVLAIRWSSHSYGDVRNFCDKHGKPLVRLPAGYNPNQVARQILEQCGERLRCG
jgi:hypothetical protein